MVINHLYTNWGDPPSKVLRYFNGAYEPNHVTRHGAQESQGDGGALCTGAWAIIGGGMVIGMLRGPRWCPHEN